MTFLKNENQYNDEIKELISKMYEELKIKDKEILSKDKEIELLKSTVKNLQDKLSGKNKKIFGKSSEQSEYIQESIFNEAESTCDLKKEEPKIEEITYKRTKPNKNTSKKENYSNLEVVEIHHKPKEECICSNCSKEKKIIGKTSKEVLKYVPSKMYVERHITYSLVCEPCDKETGETKITTTKAPKTLLHKSMASNELLSHVISLKYIYALPLYRQESYFDMFGISLSRQTLANWIIECAKELKPVYDLMKKELIKHDYVQADETRLTVIERTGKESRANHYMWLYKTCSKIHPIVLYEHQNTRSSSCPKKFLSGFSGVLQTDGYDGYNKVENVTRLYCLAHIRRKFHEIVVNLSKEALENSLAYKGFIYCENLYKIEKEIKEEYKEREDYYEIRHSKRLKKSAEILENFISFVNESIELSLGGSLLEKALKYAQKLLPSFRILFKENTGHLEIDNNASERAIKPFVIGRKNWLFSKSTKGADSSAILYSIIETAKSNNLNAEKYLQYLMDYISNVQTNDFSTLTEVMPWSNNIPGHIKLT